MSAQRRLHANLVAFARPQPDLYDGCAVEHLDGAIQADRLDATAVGAVGLVLRASHAVPDETIAPRALFGSEASGNHRHVHTLGLPRDELSLQHLLGARVLGEDDEARRVPVDSMNDVRRSPPRVEVLRQQRVQRHGLRPSRQRHRQ